MATTTYYGLLGINKSASQAEVRRAYKHKALETHPDKFLYPGASERAKRAAEARFHKVQEAFETLNDPQKRKSYDASLEPRGSRGRRDVDLSEKQRKREQERKEWAMQVEKKHQESMRALREQSRLSTQQIGKKSAVVLQPQSLIEDMIKELYVRNPEWEVRKKRVERLKAEWAGGNRIRPTC